MGKLFRKRKENGMNSLHLSANKQEPNSSPGNKSWFDKGAVRLRTKPSLVAVSYGGDSQNRSKLQRSTTLYERTLWFCSAPTACPCRLGRLNCLREGPTGFAMYQLFGRKKKLLAMGAT